MNVWKCPEQFTTLMVASTIITNIIASEMIAYCADHGYTNHRLLSYQTSPLSHHRYDFIGSTRSHHNDDDDDDDDDVESASHGIASRGANSKNNKHRADHRVATIDDPVYEPWKAYKA